MERIDRQPCRQADKQQADGLNIRAGKAEKAGLE